MSEPDRLYKLLPAIYRLQDAKPEQGQALRTLMALIEQQFLDIEADVDQLYDDWFIETCQEWLVPYIGDLLGVRSLQRINPQVSSQRGYVANALTYRQRKGTASVLEQLARDVTQWPARSVEFFERLSTTQHLNHLRLGNFRTPDLRNTNALELVASPFETANHYLEVRRIASRRGRYNIPNVGLFLWRLQSYPLTQVSPRPVADDPTLGLYWVNPLGLDQPLFNPPNPETAITQLADEINVPGALRRRPLHDEVEQIVDAIAAGETLRPAYFDRTPVFQVFMNGVPVPPQDLVICDLSGEPNGSGSSWFRPVSAIASTRRIGIDPVLGRLAIPQDEPLPETLHVSYAYGFSGDIGGGPYDRRNSIDPDFLRRVSWQVGVSRTIATVGSETIFATLAEAIAAWNLQPPDTTGVIVLMGNETDATEMTDAAPILLKESSELLIVSADWPDVAVPDQVAMRERRPGQLSPVGRRAHLRGDLFALGNAPPESSNPGRLWLNGLLLEGRVVVQPGHLGDLQVTHCTLVPRSGGLWVEAAAATPNSSLEVTVQQSISGPLYLADTVMSLAVYDSLVDASASGHLLLSAPLVLPIAGEVRVQVGTNAPTTLTLNAADLDTLRTSLETALQAGLSEARVARQGDRLLVSGQPGQVLSFTATDSDIETVRRLGLDGAPAAIASLDPDQPAPAITLERSTVFGSVYGKALQLASEAIFTAPVLVQRRQVGCVRFSYVPTGSQVPRRYRCQPDLAIAQQLAAQDGPVTPASEATIRDRVARQIVPSFTSARYGDPAYGQLSQICPPEIRTGAEDGSEMGAFSFLKQPQREANLRLALEEYLRFGLEAGIFFVT
jgi:hypothetical protein